MIIAIDGPAGSGKSTIAKLVAKDMGLVYLDTGAMYRLVTLKALNEGILGNDGLNELDKIKKLLDDLNIDIRGNGFYLDDVDVSEEEKSSYVVVPDYQLSLAIGKAGQNARLAAKLTNWKIDIKSETQAAEEPFAGFGNAEDGE